MWKACADSFHRCLRLNSFNFTFVGGRRCTCAGRNCEKCIQYLYRPSDVEQSSPSPCVPCNCSGPGIALGQLNGDCVMNAETAESLPDMVRVAYTCTCFLC